MRAYGVLIGSARTTDAMEAVVSLATITVVVLAIRVLRGRKPPSAVVNRLIVAGFVAPIPIMWSEIMHWRYYSFVYFFFLFAVVVRYFDKRRASSTPRAVSVDA